MLLEDFLDRVKALEIVLDEFLSQSREEHHAVFDLNGVFQLHLVPVAVWVDGAAALVLNTGLFVFHGVRQLLPRCLFDQGIHL